MTDDRRQRHLVDLDNRKPELADELVRDTRGHAGAVSPCANSRSAGAGGLPGPARPADVVAERRPDYSGGVAPYALDPAAAERLWETATAALAP
ncbi:hypothetical protein SHIRM173S_09136 [Streptomyces hirsutus]